MDDDALPLPETKQEQYIYAILLSLLQINENLERIANALEKQGEKAPEKEKPEIPLPRDMPGYEELVAAGIDTFEKLEAVEDLEAILDGPTIERLKALYG